jgi:argininosuccinate lyase
MLVRDRVNALCETVIGFRKELLLKSEKSLDIIMPGYTHWQQAQPVTASHYIMAHVEASERCVKRLENAYKMTNLNPLGAAALAGTTWNINRRRTAELLGFSGLIENSYDAIATRDFIFDVAGAIVILMINISRLSEDMQIWATVEFSSIDFPEEFAGTSSIMPQKKNPHILEALRGHASQAVGDLVTILTSMKGVSYTNMWDQHELQSTIERMINSAQLSVKIMGRIISKLEFNRDILFERVASGFSTTTDLADMLVRERGLSFRNSHDVVADMVIEALRNGKAANEIDSEDLERAAEKVLGKNLNFSTKEIMKALDPVESVEQRKVTGGPSSEAVKKMISNQKESIKKETEKLTTRKTNLEKAYEEMDLIEQELLKS